MQKFLNQNHIVYTVVFLVTIFWFGLFAICGVDMHHDGIMMKPAADVAAGQTLFRDTFTQYGLLTVWIQALFVRLFGEQLIWIRFSTVLFYALTAVCLLRTWRRILPGHYYLGVIALYWLLPGFYIAKYSFLPWSSVYALFFVVLTIDFLISGLQSDSKYSWFLAGCAGALAFWCRQPNGLALAAGGGLTLLLAWFRPEWHPAMKWRRVGLFTAGGLLFLILPVIYLSAAGALNDWFIQSIRFAYRFSSKDNNINVYYWNPFSAEIIYILLAMITIFYNIRSFFRIIIKRATDFDWLLLAAAAVAATALLQHYPIICVRHCYWAAIPGFGLLMVAIRELLHLPKARYLKIFGMALLLASLLPALHDRATGIYAHWQMLRDSRQCSSGVLRRMTLLWPFAEKRADG